MYFTLIGDGKGRALRVLILSWGASRSLSPASCEALLGVASKLEGPDNRGCALSRKERKGESWRRGSWAAKGALLAYDDPVRKVQGAIYYIYWGLITRRVCLGGGPTGAVVWQCLCRGRP